jgi:hypothetical protein
MSSTVPSIASNNAARLTIWCCCLQLFAVGLGACQHTGTDKAPLMAAGTGVAAPVSGQAAPVGAEGASSTVAGASSAPHAGSAGVGSAGVAAVGGGGVAGVAAGAGAAGTPANGGAGGANPDAGTSQADAGPVVACNPADRTPDATVVPISSIKDNQNSAPIAPAKGPMMPVVEQDPGLKTHTVFRPMMLPDATKLPIVVWAEGGCVKNGTLFGRFLLEIASYGFVIVADGTPNGTGMGQLTTDGVPQTKAMDWIVAENSRPCSKYYQKLDTSKIAAMGQSCGGLMTLGAAGDPRLTTVVIWNSGLLQKDQKIYDSLHAPMAYFIGGSNDVSYPQAEADFAAITKVPVFYANLPVGHFATYSEDNGGEFARVGIGWLKWQLYGDTSANGQGMFVGADCGLCKGTMWTVKKKNLM